MLNYLKTSAAAFNTKRERGFAMTEVILAIVIGVGLIVGGIVAFGNAQLSSNFSDASRALVSVSSETRAYNRTAADFNAASEATLISAGAVSRNLLNDVDGDGTVDIALPYDGVVTVAMNGTNSQEFDVTVTWPDTDKANALCSRLAAPVQDGGVGPMGTDYRVGTCAADGTNVAVTAIYGR